MKGTGAKRNVCPGSCVSSPTGAKFPVAPVESAPMFMVPLFLAHHIVDSRYASTTSFGNWLTALTTIVGKKSAIK